MSEQLGLRAKGRSIASGKEGIVLREVPAPPVLQG